MSNETQTTTDTNPPVPAGEFTITKNQIDLPVSWNRNRRVPNEFYLAPVKSKLTLDLAIKFFGQNWCFATLASEARTACLKYSQMAVDQVNGKFDFEKFRTLVIAGLPVRVKISELEDKRDEVFAELNELNLTEPAETLASGEPNPEYFQYMKKVMKLTNELRDIQSQIIDKRRTKKDEDEE